MQFWTVDELPLQPVEVEPGVTIERRAVLRMALHAAGAAALGGVGLLPGCRSVEPEGAARVPPATDEPDATALEPERLTPGEFVHRIRPQARALLAAERPDEDGYLSLAADLLARMEPEALWRPIRSRDGVGMGTVAYFPPVVLYEIRMAPDAVIHLHDHRHYNGVLRCVEGSVRCRNFDIVVPHGSGLDVAAGNVPPKGEEFVIRQTRDDVLLPGMRSTLSRDRDNIHHVEAGPEGGRLIDLFTHFRPEARSYSLTWDGEPFDAANGLFKVAWST